MWSPVLHRWMTQHGFRYVELTIQSDGGVPVIPSLDMLEAVNIRSSVAQTGQAAFSDLMLNQVQRPGSPRTVLQRSPCG